MALVLTNLVGCAQPPETNEAWAQWRGRDGSGVSTESGLPTAWDESGILWRTPLDSEGVSSPIVSGSRVFLTAESRQDADTSVEVLAVDLDSGELLWQTPILTRGREDFPIRAVINSAAGPTPAADGELVYAYFGSHLVALDYSGEIVWLEEIDPGYLEHAWYGAGSSLVLSGDLVIVLRDRERTSPEVAGWIAAYDRRTGERRWRTKWSNTCCSYASALVREGDSTDEIIVFHAAKIAAYDSETGEKIWQRKHSILQPAASPAIEGDTVCVANGSTNDKNISCFGLTAEKKPRARPREIWASSRWAPTIASPVLYQNRLYLLAENGTMKCLDGTTGKGLWSKRLAQGPYFASLVAGDGKVYAVTSYGRVSVLAAGPTFERLAENDIGGTGIVASPALVEGSLIFRTAEGLVRVGGGEPTPASG